mmetsp:Transcript_31531/g.83793  ORF Transcript_31531/g.83793 Transcript_31531/m.83793 type:complete len:217 (-) Transcript_31531:716-1366(-)
MAPAFHSACNRGMSSRSDARSPRDDAVSMCCKSSHLRSASSVALLAAGSGPSGRRQGSSCRRRGGSAAAPSAAPAPSGKPSSPPSGSTSAHSSDPPLAPRIHSGPAFFSSSASDSTGSHSPPAPGRPQAPGPEPSRKARTAPVVSTATGNNSADRPTQRSRAPGLSGNLPAASRECVWACRSRNSRASSLPSPRGPSWQPGWRVTARSRPPRAASA